MKEWEDICDRCGLCCFEKVEDRNGQWELSRIPCQHLDIVERHCRVYDKRLSVGESCVRLTPDIIKEADWLPETCAYRTELEVAKN